MDMLPDFQSAGSVEPDFIQSMIGRVPDELLELWCDYGYGTAVDGFIKIIDPVHYAESLEGCLPRPHMVPVLATGFGDIIVRHESYYLNFLFRFGAVRAIGSSIEMLPVLLQDADYLSEELSWDLYTDAVVRLGRLRFEECFGFVPLLALGGRERVENLEKLETIRHAQLVTQTSGAIQ